jgi:hydroxyacylglutathione hydrolase
MIVERSISEGWLSNSWLVADRPGGRAVVIDPGAPPGHLRRTIAAQGLRPTHVLLTHHHPDHVLHAGELRSAYDCEVLGHGAERELFADAGCPLDRELADGEELRTGELRLRALHIPGHTRGQLAFVVNEALVFTGDTLFRGSVGGTRGRGHGTFEELRRSILEVLLTLPEGLVVHPGHGDSTTIGHELAHNPFVRAWRGAELPAPRACSALGRQAQLLLEARDYDGGTKCWVRFEDGSEDVVPGSRVGAPTAR